MTMSDADKKIVVLFTPGVDSFLTRYRLEHMYDANDINYYYVNLGSRYTDPELYFILKYYNEITICNRLTMTDLEHEDAHMPNRNLLLCTLAQSEFDADIIYLNGVKDDRVSDNTNDFRRSLSNVLSMSAGKKVEIRSCFDFMEKSQAVSEWFTKNKSNKIEILQNTFSCFNVKDPINEKHDVDVYVKLEHNKYTLWRTIEYIGCLECGACYRKLCAMTCANVYVNFKNKDLNDKYVKDIENIKQKLPNRANSILEYNTFLEWVKTNG